MLSSITLDTSPSLVCCSSPIGDARATKRVASTLRNGSAPRASNARTGFAATMTTTTPASTATLETVMGT